MADGPEQKTLDVAKRIQEIRAMYDAKPQNTKANFLIYSRTGAGKTKLLATCPAPILIHSFDPGGTKTIKPEIDKGRVIVDNRFEAETGEKDGGRLMYKEWQDEFNKLKRMGFFDLIGTYVIDSGTRWLASQMNEIGRQEKRSYGEVQIQDHNKQQIFAADAITTMLALPCNFVMTGHMESYEDKTDGRTHMSLLAHGKNKIKIPLLFDEFYYLDVQETSKGLERRLLTQITGKHEARTRIGGPGLGNFDMWEKPDIAYLLKKAGYPYEDKQIG